MITLSSRFLALLVTAVVGVSLAGSMLGYAIGARGQVSRNAAAIAPAAAAAQDSGATAAPGPGGSEQPAATNSAASTDAVPAQPAKPAAPARLPDTQNATNLPVGAVAAKGGVGVAVTDAQPSEWEQGMEVRLMLTNTSGQDLHFFFSPEQALKVEDNRGVHWDLRWAEYDGEVTLPNGEKRQLVRALYHGELQHPDVDHLTLTLRDTVGISEASWSIPVPRLQDTVQP